MLFSKYSKKVVPTRYKLASLGIKWSIKKRESSDQSSEEDQQCQGANQYKEEGHVVLRKLNVGIAAPLSVANHLWHSTGGWKSCYCYLVWSEDVNVIKMNAIKTKNKVILYYCMNIHHQL